MHQLSGMDNVFLRLEHGNQYMHVAGLGIYDPSTAPDGKVRFKDILKFFETRLDSAPVFRRRLVTVPMGLDRPYWVEDAHVDVEFHVRHVALPFPGDWRQLCIQVARIHSRPLDRSKPLWEAYVIEGLDNIAGIPPGSFAFYIKFHHAAIDGEGGTVVLQAIHSFSPDPDEEEGVRRARVRDREPTQVELYARALVNTVQRVPRAASFSAKTAARLAGVGAGYMGQLKQMLQEAGLPSAETVKSKLRRPPVTRFSAKVSAHRVVEMIGLPMADDQEGAPADRGSDDQRRVHDDRRRSAQPLPRRQGRIAGPYADGAGTDESARRGQGWRAGQPDRRGGDAAAFRDRRTRSRGCMRSRPARSRPRRMVAMVGKDLTKHVYDLLPAVASELFTSKVMVPTMNIVVSNVRGPDVPLYMAGAQMVAFAPVSIAMNGLGLNVTGFSYHGTLWICSVACRDMMPDPEFFADCLRKSFAGLVAAGAETQAATRAAQPAVPVARSRKAATKSKARGKAAPKPTTRAARRKRGARRRTA